MRNPATSHAQSITMISMLPFRSRRKLPSANSVPVVGPGVDRRACGSQLKSIYASRSGAHTRLRNSLPLSRLFLDFSQYIAFESLDHDAASTSNARLRWVLPPNYCIWRLPSRFRLSNHSLRLLGSSSTDSPLGWKRKAERFHEVLSERRTAPCPSGNRFRRKVKTEPSLEICFLLASHSMYPPNI